MCSLSPTCVHMRTHTHTHSHFMGLFWIPVQIAALKRLESETLINLIKFLKYENDTVNTLVNVISLQYTC